MGEPGKITATDISALILCGGRGKRMGLQEKALIPLRGQTVLERMAARLSGQVREIMLGCSDNSASYETCGFPLVQDGRVDAGPLAGIEAGLLACKTPLLFVCPGDTPDIAPDIVNHLVDGIGTGEVAVADDGERIQNLFLLMRKSVVVSLTSWLDRGERSVSGWLQRVGARPVRFSDQGQFTNLNTEDDLRNWMARNR